MSSCARGRVTRRLASGPEPEPGHAPEYAASKVRRESYPSSGSTWVAERLARLRCSTSRSSCAAGRGAGLAVTPVMRVPSDPAVLPAVRVPLALLSRCVLLGRRALRGRCALAVRPAVPGLGSRDTDAATVIDREAGFADVS